MTSFLVRVDLPGAADEDYWRLDCAMEQIGFLTSIPNSEGQRFAMPMGEYFYQGHKTVGFLCEMGWRAAAVMGQKARVLVAEIVMVAFDLEAAQPTKRSQSSFD